MSARNGVQELPPKYARVSTAARWSGLSVRILRKMINAGHVKAYRPNGSFLLIELDALDAMIRRRVKPRRKLEKAK